MEFLKKQNLFSFLYDGKSIWNCEFKKWLARMKMKNDQLSWRCRTG